MYLLSIDHELSNLNIKMRYIPMIISIVRKLREIRDSVRQILDKLKEMCSIVNRT